MDEVKAWARDGTALGGVRGQLDDQVAVARLLRRSCTLWVATGARLALEHVDVVCREGAKDVEALLVIVLQRRGRSGPPRSWDQRPGSFGPRNTCPQPPGNGSTPLRRAAACV